jgi:DNA-binding NarL/FixJ family response regulator
LRPSGRRTNNDLREFAERLAGLPPATQDVQLTPRELGVLELLGNGASGREIAPALVIAESTVKGHVKALRVKMSQLSARRRCPRTSVAHHLTRG